MAAAALRFLAHCFKMTLPVSLSTSAGREREDLYLFFSPSSFSLPSHPLRFSAVWRLRLFPPSPGFLCARLFLSLPPSLPVFSEQGAPTSPLPWSCWGGGWERREGGGEKGGRTDNLAESQGGGGILQVATVSQLIGCTEPVHCRMNKHYLCPSPARQRGETRVFVCALRECVVCLYC